MPMPLFAHVKIDTGYTKICPDCHARYDDCPTLIGRSREVRVIRCNGCDRRPRKIENRDKSLK